MRLKILSRFCITFLLLALVIISCKPRHGSQPKVLIQGKWNIVAATDKEGKSIMDDLREGTIEFTKDFKVIVVIPGETEKGMYSLSEDGKKFTVVQEDGRSTDNEITKLTKDKLEFKDLSQEISIKAER